MSPESGLKNEIKKDWKIWKSVVAGGKNKAAFIEEIKHAPINLSRWADYVLWSEELHTLPNEEKIDLVRTSVRDLRFTDNPTTEQIYKSLPQFGLETCPPDVITKIINSNEAGRLQRRHADRQRLPVRRYRPRHQLRHLERPRQRADSLRPPHYR